MGRTDAAIALALLAATIALFGRAVLFEFVDLDDMGYVTENSVVLEGLTWRGATWALTATQEANWHPLTWLSHMLDVSMFGSWAGGHHLTSVLIHALNAAALYLVLRAMTGARYLSAMVAGLFAFHPLHVESVVWVSERKDVLSALFGLASLAAWRAWVVRPGWGRYALALVLFAAGLAAKPMLVTWPFVMLLLDMWPLGRLDAGSGVRAFVARLGVLAREKAPFFVLSALSCVVTVRAQALAGAVVALEALPLDSRLANAAVSYVRYLSKTLWPVDLGVAYPGTTWSAAAVAGSIAFLVAVSAFVVWQARRRPYLAVGWFWYVGMLVPVIGVVQVGMQAMADRYTYLPLVGVFVAASWGATEWGGRIQGRRRVVPGVGALVILAALAAATFGQMDVWRNSVRLFQHSLRVNGDTPTAHNGLGVRLARNGHLDEAIAHFETAFRVLPNDTTLVNLGFALAVKGRFDEAIANYRTVLAHRPTHPRALRYLGEALDRTGRTEEAIAAYRASLAVDPQQPGLLDLLGSCLALAGRPDEAIDAYTASLDLAPRKAEVLNNLGAALEGMRRVPEAEARYREAMALSPDYVEPRLNLAGAMLRSGRAEDALVLYEAILVRHPEHPGARAGAQAARAAAGLPSERRGSPAAN